MAESVGYTQAQVADLWELGTAPTVRNRYTAETAIRFAEFQSLEDAVGAVQSGRVEKLEALTVYSPNDERYETQRKELLSTGNDYLSTNEIGRLWGFENPGGFTNRFKGITRLQMSEAYVLEKAIDDMNTLLTTALDPVQRMRQLDRGGTPAQSFEPVVEEWRLIRD
ncbi:MAG: hypothetical protein ABEI52_00585 [Halobacteriaceae archaeon]